MSQLRSAFLIAVILSFGLSRPAGAEESPQTRAAALLEEASRLFADAEDFEAARTRFRQAYELDPSWQALNGIALVYTEEGRPVDAIETYESLVRRFGANLTSGQRATVERRLAQLRKQVVTIRVHAEQPGVEVRIGGRQVGRAPFEGRFYVLPGRHTLTASLKDHVSIRREIEGAAGKVYEFSLALTPTQPEPSPSTSNSKANRPARTMPPAGQPDDASKPTWLGPTVIAAGAGVALAGGITLISAARDYDRFDRSVRRSANALPNPVAADTSARDRGDAKRISGLTLVGVGAALVATGVTIVLVQPSRHTTKRPHRKLVVAPTGPGLALAGTF